MSDIGLYSEAIEQQLATLRWIEQGGSDNVIQAIVDMNLDKYDRKLNSATRDKYASGLVEAVLKILTVPLLEGDPYYWSADLLPALESLAASVPLDWTLDDGMLPSPAGYLRFARPLPLPEYVGADRIGTEDLVAISWIRASLPITGGTEDDVCLAFHTSDVFRQSGNPATLCPWPIETSLQSRMDEARVHPSLRDQVKTMERWHCKLRYFAAAIAFMNTTIASAPPTWCPRSTRKRLEREKWQHEPLVRVVQLRRRRPHPDGPASFVEVDWKWQWVVAPHWRNQWFPSEHRYKRIPIASYVKGPIDKPLKPPSTRLFAVTR